MLANRCVAPSAPSATEWKLWKGTPACLGQGVHTSKRRVAEFQAGERASEGRGCSWRGTLITDSAMGAFHSSLFTCGVIASIIEMDGTRGEKAAQFKASRFYTNALGVQAYCLRAEKQEVMLVTFNSVPRFGSYRTEVLLRQKDALLWLEIMNEKEDSQLRQQYI